MAAKEIYSVFSLGNVLKSVSDDFHGYSRCYLSDAWIHFLNNKNRNQVMSRWMFLKAPPERHGSVKEGLKAHEKILAGI
ncbi:hypothetical protein P5673_002693 [Acropora cervicornis]|uniref:Uncharacterized protein n=1 Tax=Acropora cervicornis TaxID=6130 RepID=A0AAD9VFE9_ACRCE|nr:hypothetical protein P5673_002693 [Acropora cervicornis]